MIPIEFDRGSLVLDVPVERREALSLPGCVADSRVGKLRAKARRYRDIITALTERREPYEDRARQYEERNWRSRLERTPFPYQQEALDAWKAAGKRGVVVLPTGAGKTYVAQMMMSEIGRDTLVVTPTLELMRQWYTVLGVSFDVEVGLIGGGSHDPRPITVTTYDSAFLHMERLGNRFGMVIFDECHHLPGPSYLLASDSLLAPFRLGLTATPERQDGRESLLDEAIGPIVYRRDIQELRGEFLSEYETMRLTVSLSDEEREEYEHTREIYRRFLRDNMISMASRHGWTRFLALSSRSEEGRRAFLAYRRQKAISQASPAKLRLLRRLFEQHAKDRMIVFTQDNATVYKISKDFLIPAITHQTKVKERKEILDRFHQGTYPFLVTSKVLNEGVDVPAANVGVILSGSGSVREHVQRLGRILRRAEGKHALLYEIITRGTTEEYVSERRRNHSAYQ